MLTNTKVEQARRLRIRQRLKSAVVMSQALMAEELPADLGIDEEEEKDETVGPSHRTRTRRPVNSIFQEQGPIYVRRAYRMHANSFWDLHELTKDRIGNPERVAVGSTKTHRNGARNGLITSSIRLSAAIRYFAGGRPDDIALVHGISHTEVYNSVWKVVDAVNSCPKLDIVYPEDAESQWAIAAEFQKKSAAGFSNCAGAIDGMLIWFDKPTREWSKTAGVGRKKFFCGRKKKFGVNLQGVCDVNGVLLDLFIGHPAATSDHLSFATSSLYDRLENHNLLAEGLCLYGDNAYVNAPYMATPFSNVRSGSKDDYNFYHSQVRRFIAHSLICPLLVTTNIAPSLIASY